LNMLKSRGSIGKNLKNHLKICIFPYFRSKGTLTIIVCLIISYQRPIVNIIVDF
jgi:hypothetical protein